MSEPLLVEAIEELFEPVLIHNNAEEGYDEEVRLRFTEPSWNNPVVRFLDADGEDVIPRKDRVWIYDDVVRRVEDALKAADRPVPTWFELVAGRYRMRDDVAFRVKDFRAAQATFGALPGLTWTQAVHENGELFLRVATDSSVVPFSRVLRLADELGATAVHVESSEQETAAREVFGDRVQWRERGSGWSIDSDHAENLYYLRRSHLRFVPLEYLQACRVNSALASDQDVDAFLSPRQQRLRKRIEEVLRESPDALDDMRQPDRIRNGLRAEYTDRLVARLDAAKE